MNEEKGLSGTKLKIIAMTSMFIDHTAAVLLEDYLNKVIPLDVGREMMRAWFKANPQAALLEMLMITMRLIGRFGFPLFAFLLVEGFLNTKSRIKYAISLGAFALISELPFNLGFKSMLFYRYYQNVFFTLLFGLLCLMGMQYLGESKKNAFWQGPLYYLAALCSGPFVTYMSFKNFWPVQLLFLKTPVDMKWAMIIGSGVVSLIAFSLIGLKWDEEKKTHFSSVILSLSVFCIVAELCRTDYGGGGVLTIAVMYLLRGRRQMAYTMGCLVLTLMEPAEATAFLMLKPVSMYNGERGMRINKYVFYAFYPVHLGLLYLLTLLLGFTTFSLGL